MNRQDIITRLEALDLDKTQYWVITGSAMVLYGLRNQTHDIDLGCTRQLADSLQNQGCPTTVMADGTRKIQLQKDIEVFENWIFDGVTTIEDIPVISLNGLVEMKKALGREKDRRDIALIEAALANLSWVDE